MFQGTGSDVGKTVMVAGLCRALANRGLRVVPFKPQNMSNNAAVADIPGEAGGGEIGRAQWLQALACRVAASVHMNPVLLKPQSETGSQIIVQGQVWGQAKGRDYQKIKPELLGFVMQSFDQLSAEADIVLIEGAGSPAEVNLRASDIANMGFAQKANVPVVLVGDIDRGGVIASLVGTDVLLEPGDRQRIAGYIINKFRGDLALFNDGLTVIGEHTGWRCFGVVPWLDGVARLPAEDSVALGKLIDSGRSKDRSLKRVKIAVPLLDRIANFDDFDPLISEPSVELVMVAPGTRLPDDAALIILPGTKSTISDLQALRANGWDTDLTAHVAKGGWVIGICGGLQMLGKEIRDPQGLEGGDRQIKGLGYLDIETDLAPQKTVQNTKGRHIESGSSLEGYEIHMGVTMGVGCDHPMIEIGGRTDGAVSADGRIMGCYLHGFFNSGGLMAWLLGQLGADHGGGQIHAETIDQALEQLAGALETHLDIDALLKLAG